MALAALHRRVFETNERLISKLTTQQSPSSSSQNVASLTSIDSSPISTEPADLTSGFSVSGTFNRPSVDWRNKSSPNYWSKLGGVFLGTSDASSLRLFLPPGEHMLAAVVEDELGAVPDQAPGCFEQCKIVQNKASILRVRLSGLQCLAGGTPGSGAEQRCLTGHCGP